MFDVSHLTSNHIGRFIILEFGQYGNNQADLRLVTRLINMLARIVRNRCSVLRFLPILSENYQKPVLLGFTKCDRVAPLAAFLSNERIHHIRNFSNDVDYEIDALKFEEVCEETLESLCEFFEDVLENNLHLKGTDVTYGVCSVMF